MPYSSDEDVYSVIIRALEKVDERIGQFTSLAAENGRSPNVKFRKAYQSAKNNLNHTLASQDSSALIISAAFTFLAAASNFVNAASTAGTEEDKRFQRSTVKMIDGYIKHISGHIEKDSHPSSLNAEFQLLEGSLDSQRREILSLEKRLNTIGKELGTVYGPLQRQFDELQLRFSNDLTHINQKKKEIDGLTGIVTGKAITSSYLRSSIYEKKTADDLRNAALAAMTLVCIFVGISFVYATIKTFELAPSLFRLTFAVILSVPAAYLARESAKHRKQQYEYLQTALDVQAITPYIASLPEASQHRLKEEMAARIFVTKSFDHITKESYPINLQELVVAVMSATKSEEKNKEKSTADKENKEKEK